ncbi:hypothetical protein TRAPUB_5488 [Trametes pubescens]|uniref:Uncharacterized protein n=1 Tax=Trametes pubescens TaxID=154538 RepID=A0A1M2W7F2_TRAPU|nr:hypothetical protein TRAPUB_5488 [Trametes pubescens]
MGEITIAQDQKQYTPAALGSADDWLGCDHDVETPVYLFVQPSLATGFRDAQWCIAWPVGGLTEERMTAWRHIRVDACMSLVDPDEGQQYRYSGPITKTGGPGTAKRFMLINTTLAMRKKIEQLAQDDYALSSGEDFGSAVQAGRVWVEKLLDAMVTAGLISSNRRDRVVHQASSNVFGQA